MVIAILSFAAGAGIAAALFMGIKRGLASRERESESSLTQFRVELQRELGQLRTGMQQQTLDLSRQMNTQLAENTRFLEQTHQDYRKTVGQMENRLGELQEATRSMIEIGKDISSLEDILKAPKLRGGFGELILAELLRQVLPADHFSLQYSFRSGLIVDAVILLAEGMVPVDAKFPLENFKRIFEAADESPRLFIFGGAKNNRAAARRAEADLLRHGKSGLFFPRERGFYSSSRQKDVGRA